MLKKNSINIYTMLFIILIIGIALNGAFNDKAPSEEITGIDLLLRCIGFLMIAGSIVAILFIVLRPNQQTGKEQIQRWKTIRSEGRKSFVRNNTVRFSYIIAIALIGLSIVEYLTNNSLLNIIKINGLTAFFIITITPILFSKMWDDSEQQYSLSDNK